MSSERARWTREVVFEDDGTVLEPPARFAERCAAFGIELEAAEVTRLGHYLALLLANNTRVNLTAIREPEEAWERHLFDSLTLLGVLSELPEGAEVIDVGSGGGLPGIPLAIAMPGLRFALLEATGKKASWLRYAVGRLGLENAIVVEGRAEAIGREAEHRSRYSAGVARAVGPMRVIAELVVPLVAVGGVIGLIKGQQAGTELAEAKSALHLLHATHETTLGTPTGQIVVLGKHRSTPGAYPRRPGEPKHHPL